MQECSYARLVRDICNILKQSNIHYTRKKVNSSYYISTRRSTVKLPKLDKNIAYLAGYILGDGCLIKSRRKKGGFYYELRIFSKNYKTLLYLGELFRETFGINPKIIKETRKPNVYFYLTIKNVVVFEYFSIIGLPTGKKEEYYVPTAVKNEKNLFLEFLAGLCDSDGHIRGQKIYIKQKSKMFIEDLINTCNKFDIQTSKIKVNFVNGKPYYYIWVERCYVPLRIKDTCRRSSAGRARDL